MADQKDLYQEGRIVEEPLRELLETSFLEYAMSVIVGRAIPDARDGLKPVHRRILYSMLESGYTANKPTVKCAKIVGQVIGNFHPHGEAAVYDALVRMGQDFNMRYPLITPQGNFGSIDGDPPAAYRYTEAKLSELGEYLLADIKKETVDFIPTFDGETQEPVVLTAGVPVLLMNGSEGIAVGMATRIPPHNLKELVGAVKLLIEKPEATTEELMQHVRGPDFPTGGVILGDGGIKSAYETGRGTIHIRGRVEIELDQRDRSQLVIKEVPFQINKAQLIEQIVKLSKEGKIEGITDIRDESDRSGIRVVIELARKAVPKVIERQLLRYTRLQTTYPIQMLALVDGVPRVCSLRKLLQVFIDHRREVIRRRSEFELKKAKERAHILEGLKIALDNIDRVVEIIRASEKVSEARQALMEEFDLTQVQAQHILDMPLKTLTGLEVQKILDELEALYKKIAELEELLKSPKKIDQALVSELEQAAEKFGDERRTLILPDADPSGEFDEAALIKPEDIVITMTRDGYIKRVPLSTFRAQLRGGRGLKGQATRPEDVVEHLVVANTHDFVLYFTDRGKVYSSRGYHVPAYERGARGIPVVNLLSLESDEKVTAMLALPPGHPYRYLFLVTELGTVKRVKVEEFEHLRSTGKRAILLDEAKGDRLRFVIPTTGGDHVMLLTRAGKAVWFKEEEVRVMGTSAHGVVGVRLSGEDDRVVGADVVTPEDTILVVGENGYGKRTSAKEFRHTHRGTQGVIAMKVTEKTGPVVAGYRVEEKDEIMIITTGGLVIRQKVGEIPRYGRNTQGVRLINLKPGDRVASVDVVRQHESYQI